MNINVRALVEADRKRGLELDRLNNDNVFKIYMRGDNTDQDCLWGIFVDDLLVGYCAINKIKEPFFSPFDVPRYPIKEYKKGAILLSDVFIVEEYRHRGLATQMIEEVIRYAGLVYKEPLIFLVLAAPELYNLYSKIGFEWATEDEDMIMYTHAKVEEGAYKSDCLMEALKAKIKQIAFKLLQ